MAPALWPAKENNFLKKWTIWPNCPGSVVLIGVKYFQLHGTGTECHIGVGLSKKDKVELPRCLPNLAAFDNVHIRVSHQTANGKVAQNINLDLRVTLPPSPPPLLFPSVSEILCLLLIFSL